MILLAKTTIMEAISIERLYLLEQFHIKRIVNQQSAIMLL